MMKDPNFGMPKRYEFDVWPKNETLTKSEDNFFVLLFAGRTGTTFVLDVLNQHPKVKFEGEWLGTFKDKADSSALQTEWIKTLFSPENASSFKAIGFKTKFYDIPDKAAFRLSLDEFRPTILVSQRRNILKQAISAVRIKHFAELKRQEMGEEEWRAVRFGNKVWNVFRKGGGVGKIPLDVQEVNHMARVLDRSAKELDDFVESLNLNIAYYDYEDLIRDTPLFFEKLFHLLGVEPIQYKTNVFKHTPDNLSEVVENFGELQEFFAGTCFEKFLV